MRRDIMFPVLEDYCAIYAATHDWARKERHWRLQAWRQTQYALMPDYAEMRAFLAEMERQSIVRISTPFFLKVVFPVCDVEIFQHHCLEAMKFILERQDDFMAWKKDYSIDLLQMALAIAPDDEELLTRKYTGWKDYYACTIHEIPSGVLYDANGASIAQTRENLAGLQEFEQLCQRLRRDEREIIEACRFYYSLWIEYLSDPETQRKNFAQYLAGRTYPGSTNTGEAAGQAVDGAFCPNPPD
jgi:hypothetical protein